MSKGRFNNQVLIGIYDRVNHFLRHVNPEVLIDSPGNRTCFYRCSDDGLSNFCRKTGKPYGEKATTDAYYGSRAQISGGAGFLWSITVQSCETEKCKHDKEFGHNKRYCICLPRVAEIFVGIYMPDAEPGEEFWLHVNDNIFVTKISNSQKIFRPFDNTLFYDNVRSHFTAYFISTERKRSFYAIFVALRNEMRFFLGKYSYFVRLPGKDLCVWYYNGLVQVYNVKKDAPFSTGEIRNWNKYETFEFKYFDRYAGMIQQAFREYNKSELKWKRKMKGVFEEILWLPGGWYCEFIAVRWKEKVELQEIFKDPDYHKKRKKLEIYWFLKHE